MVGVGVSKNSWAVRSATATSTWAGIKIFGRAKNFLTSWFLIALTFNDAFHKTSETLFIGGAKSCVATCRSKNYLSSQLYLSQIKYNKKNEWTINAVSERSIGTLRNLLQYNCFSHNLTERPFKRFNKRTTWARKAGMALKYFLAVT